jgi:hypothetical protein
VGRPRVSAELRKLIGEMSRANPLREKSSAGSVCTIAGTLSRSKPSPVTGVGATTWNAGIWDAGAGVAGRGTTLIFRYFLRYFSSTHRTDLSRFRGTFHSFDPVGFAIFAIRVAG